MPLLAEGKDDVSEIPFAGRVDDVGGAGALAAHAHVERSGETERQVASGGLELHGIGAEIEQDAIDRVVPGLTGDGVEIGEPIFDQGQAALSILDQTGAARDGTLIAIDGDNFAVGSRQNSARIAAGTEGAIDIDAAVTHIEKIPRGAAEHGNVEGRSASDS